MDTNELFNSLADGMSRSMAHAHREMVRRGMLARAEDGLPIGKLPLGYCTWGHKVRPAQPQAALIARAFAWMDEEGLPVRAAWRRATDMGLRSRRGKPLSASAFHLVIRNPFYAGYVKFWGDLHKGSHEPLVPEAVFWRVQRQVDGHLPQKPAPSAAGTICSGH